MNYNIKFIQPVGVLNAMSAGQLRCGIKDIIFSEKNIVVLIDLQNVNFIDSSGLGILVSIMQIVKSSESQLFLCSVKEQVKMLFELTKIDNIFRVFKDRDEFNRYFLENEILKI